MFWLVLIILGFIATLVYVAFKIQRTTQEGRRRSEERAAELLLALKKDAPQPAPPPAGATAEARSQAKPTVPAAAAGALRRRPSILSDTQRLLYSALRAALPDHALLAHVRIVDLLDLSADPGAIERDARLRALLRERLDFVVCNSDLIPLAALVVYAPGIESVPDESVKVEALRELGVRFLRFRGDSLPRPTEIRSLVLG